MRANSRSIFFGVVVGFGLGVTGAQALGRIAAVDKKRPVSTTSPASGAGDLTAQRLSRKEWLSLFDTIDWTRPDDRLLAQMQQSLAASPELRLEVLRLYRTHQDLRVRSVLRGMLTDAPADDVVSHASRMARSDDVGDRAVGFELIAAMPTTTESMALVRKALSSERDAQVLAAVLLALRPKAPPSPAEIAEMVPRFVQLVRHEGPLVRAHSIQLVAEWDRAGHTAEPVVAAGFEDRAPVVRQAAVGAVMVGQLRSDRLKALLLGVMGQESEDIQTRFGAQQALERFDMSTEEYGRYVVARNALLAVAESLGATGGG